MTLFSCSDFHAGSNIYVHVQQASSQSPVHTVAAGLEWASSTGKVPEGAVEGGYRGNGKPLYVARVLAPDGKYRGAKSHTEGSGVDARYAYNGEVTITTTFDFLVVFEDNVILDWVPAGGGDVPVYAVQAERDEYYICRQEVPQANELVIGYLDTEEGVCKFPTINLVWEYPEYEVLCAIPPSDGDDDEF